MRIEEPRDYSDEEVADRAYNAGREAAKRLGAKQPGRYGGLVRLISELDAVWSFDDNQRHTHNWHDKQDFMQKIRQFVEAADAIEALDGGWVSVTAGVVKEVRDGEIHSRLTGYESRAMNHLIGQTVTVHVAPHVVQVHS